MASTTGIEIYLDETPLANSTIQRMLFISNALEQGWSVKKRNDAYIFSKKHEGKREIFSDDYLDKFIASNLGGDLSKFPR
jgi:hypothetical protein